MENDDAMTGVEGTEPEPQAQERVEDAAPSSEAGEAASQGVKRKYSLVVKNVPKNHDQKKFAKFLQGHDVSFSKIKKVYGVQVGVITFEDEKGLEDARTKLTDKVYGAQKILVDIPADKNPFHEQKGEDKRPVKPLPDSIADVVTPWHNVAYEEQLRRKQNDMTEVLRKITKQIATVSSYDVPLWVKDKRKGPACPLVGIKASPVTDDYRNKVEFTFGTSKDGKPCIGFLLGAFQDGIVAVADPADCKNVSVTAKEIRNVFQSFLDTSTLKAYDKKSQDGFWRLLGVRSTELKESLVTVQVSPKATDPQTLATLKNDLIALVQNANTTEPGLITGLHWQEYDGVSNAAPWDCPIAPLWGATHAHEQLLGLKFRISPSAFFQVNTKATEVLYSIVREWCALPPKSADGEAVKTTVLDICCGTGTIGLTMAKEVDQIVGIEMVETAIEDAKYNATLNGVDNAIWVAGKAEDKLQEVLHKALTPGTKRNVVGVVDPPRSGLHPKTMTAIRACEPIKRLVYVSCNQGALVNDAAAYSVLLSRRLQEKLCRSVSGRTTGLPFRPVKAIAVDLFPHTDHTELVVLFQRVDVFDENA